MEKKSKIENFVVAAVLSFVYLPRELGSSSKAGSLPLQALQHIALL